MEEESQFKEPSMEDKSLDQVSAEKGALTQKEADSVNEDVVVNIILNEYNQVNTRIEEFVKKQDRYIQLIITIFAAFYAFLHDKEIPNYVFAFIGIIPIVLLSQIMFDYTRALGNQVYRGYLQDELNKILSKYKYNNIAYTAIAKKMFLDDNPMVKPNTFILPGLILGTLLFSIFITNFDIIVLFANISLGVYAGYLASRIDKYRKNYNEKVNNILEEVNSQKQLIN